MRIFRVVTLIMLTWVSHAFSQDTTSARITINFKVPEGWKKVNDDVFALANFDKTYLFWSSYLSQGHQPWRLEPPNAAVACLWDFGINDGTTVFQFADRLDEIKTNELYSLAVNTTTYMIYIRIKKHIPIAYKVEIRRKPRNDE